MSKVTTITCCRLCQSTELQNVLSLSPTPAGDSYLPQDQHPERLELYPLDVYLCGKCGHAQLGALVDPSEIYTNYLYTTSVSLGLTEHFRQYAETVCTKLQLQPGSLVVDIGSNDGTLLRAFKEKGMKVLGVDPAREIARRATESGIPTLNAFFTPALATEIIAQHGHASLVIANNMVANVPNPTDFVTGVNQLIGEHGHFVWETGYVRYLTEDCVFDNVHHEHIDYYAVRPLIGFYQQFRLELFDVEATTSKGSSIRCYVRRKSSTRKIAASVEDLVKHEEDRGYFSSATYARLAARLAATRTELHEKIAAWRADGKTVAGYGAAIGTTTILYHFDLGSKLDFLVDDNPIRHGLQSPGYAIPVESAGRLITASRPDYVLILAWRYADAIIRRNQAFLQNGGAFVRVLPEVAVVTRDAKVLSTAASR